VLTRRELNSGVSVIALYVAVTLRTWFVCFFQAFAFCVLKYVLLPPYQYFGVYLMGHVGTAFWWASAAHWISLILDQKTATVVLLFLPNIWKMFDGSAAQEGLREGEEDNTIRNETLSYITPARWYMQMTYSKEIWDYPEYVQNNRYVNATLYSRDFPTDDDGYDLHKACEEGGLMLFFGPFFAPPFYILTFITLFLMKASNYRKIGGLFAGIGGFFYDKLGCCYFPAFELPKADRVREAIPKFKIGGTSKSRVSDSKSRVHSSNYDTAPMSTA